MIYADQAAAIIEAMTKPETELVDLATLCVELAQPATMDGAEPDELWADEVEPEATIDPCHYCGKPLNYEAGVYLTTNGPAHPLCAHKNGHRWLWHP